MVDATKNMFLCLIGRKTLIGYFLTKTSEKEQLPKIKKGILTPFDSLKFTDEQVIAKLNLIYARDYSIFKDFEILQKAWKKLDR